MPISQAFLIEAAAGGNNLAWTDAMKGDFQEAVFGLSPMFRFDSFTYSIPCK
jgi:hypothetical protein